MKPYRPGTSILVIITATTLLYGCAGVKYVEPDAVSAYKARFILTNPKEYYARVYILDQKTCKAQAEVGPLSDGSNADSRRIGMLDSKPPQEGILERLVAADQPIVLAVGGILPAWRWYYLAPGGGSMLASKIPRICRFPKITARAGSQYEYKYSITPGSCSVEVFELNESSTDGVIRKQIDTTGLPYFALSGDGACK